MANLDMQMNPQMEQIHGEIQDNFRALANGFQKLDKIEDSSRQSKQLEELTGKMSECEKLIEEFDREIKDEESKNPPEVNKQLNDEKQSMIKELNSYVALRKTVVSQGECNGDAKSENLSPNFTEIIVIRHGETEWNADGRIQGHLDVELNDIGRQQAMAVAARLSKERRISLIYSSDLKRAHETAEIIARSCVDVEVVKDADLRERHLGDLQGISLREAATSQPMAYKAFLSDRNDQEIPGGGESLDQLYQRCSSCLQRIAEKHRGERVVVVSHGGAIRAMHRHASPHRRSKSKIWNTSVGVLRLSDKDEWTVELWADVSHLNNTEFLSSGFGGDKTSG